MTKGSSVVDWGREEHEGQNGKITKMNNEIWGFDG